jgi:hypothetical protein
MLLVSESDKKEERKKIKIGTSDIQRKNNKKRGAE